MQFKTRREFVIKSGTKFRVGDPVVEETCGESFESFTVDLLKKFARVWSPLNAAGHKLKSI